MSSIDTSGIDPTKPVQGTPLTANVRANTAAIKTQLENAGVDIDTLNVFLAGIEAGATADQTKTEIDALILKGLANGYATLDASAKIPSAQLPALALTDVSEVASEAAMIALIAEEGDIAVRSDENKTYVHNGGVTGTVADWTLLRTPTDVVLSVAGNVGVVTIAQILTALKTVDGVGSGLDADLLDGQEAAAFALASSIGVHWLTPKSADPTTDDNGDALTEGAIYWHTTNNLHRTYDGAAWADFSGGGGSVIYKGTAGGTADALTATLTPTLASLADETIISLRALLPNATTTPTLAADGLTAWTIVKNGSQPLVAGDIAGVGHELWLKINATNTKYELLNPATGVIPDASITADKLSTSQFGGDYIKLSDVKTSGTAGGASVSGVWTTRDLNTEDSDTGGICTLSSNQFSLAAGTYRIIASAPAQVSNAHKARLYNVTDTSIQLLGSSEYTQSTSNIISRSIVTGEFTITSVKAFEIQHIVSNTDAGGFGIAGSFGVNEVYTVVELLRVKQWIL